MGSCVVPVAWADGVTEVRFGLGFGAGIGDIKLAVSEV